MKRVFRNPAIITTLIFVLVFFFLELLLRFSILNLVFDQYILRIFMFCIVYALFVVFLLRFFRRKTLVVVMYVLIIALSILYFAQDMYYRIFNSFFSFAITGDAVLGLTFLTRFLRKLDWIHLLYLLPLLVTIITMKYSPKLRTTINNLRYQRLHQPVFVLGLAFLAMTMIKISIPKDTLIESESEYNYSDYDLYEEPYSSYLATKKFGLFTYIRIDIENNLEKEETVDAVGDEIAQYLSEQADHELNDYSGLFVDKNLILITAEAFDTYAIDPDITPNIYALLSNSWYFENYYSPLYYRNTADTEFMVQTSFFPHNGVELSMESFATNHFDYTLPRMFSLSGYDTFAFHDYSDYFYPRSDFFPVTLGYDAYFGGVDMNLVEEPDGHLDQHVWPSDVDMMTDVGEILATTEQFFINILTVSGHLPYDDSQVIALGNYDYVAGILTDRGVEVPDESIIYYLAAQHEFDKAIGALMDILAEQEKAADTVIMIYGDHYAYGLDQEYIWAYDTVKEDESTIDIHNVPLLVYNPGFEQTVISNVMSSIDMIPTIANLFSLNLDYNAVMGKDALDSLSNYVQFSNGSIISDDFSYNIEKDEYTLFNDNFDLESAVISYNYMIHRKTISNLILESDYFYAIDHPDSQIYWVPQTIDYTTTARKRPNF